MISVILLSYILILSFSSAFIEAACYYPNGSIAPNDTPCRDDTAESTCCGQGYACLSNGMCQATGSELQKDGATELVRGACTDRSWRSSSCPLFCINPETDNVGGGIGVAKCQGTTQELYYCINSVQDQVNCTAKQNVLFFQRKFSCYSCMSKFTFVVVIIDPADASRRICIRNHNHRCRGDNFDSVHNNNIRAQCIGINICSNLSCHNRPVETTEPEPHNHKQCRAEPDK